VLLIASLLSGSQLLTTSTLPQGAHRIVEVAFPAWVPPEDIAAATLLSVDEALAQLPVCLR